MNERCVHTGIYWRKEKDDGTKITAVIKADALQKDGSRLLLVAVCIKQRAMCHHPYSHRGYTDLQLLTIRQMMADLASDVFEGKCLEADVKERKEELVLVRLSPTPAQAGSGSSSSAGPIAKPRIETPISTAPPTTPISRPPPAKTPSPPVDSDSDIEMPGSVLDTIPDFRSDL